MNLRNKITLLRVLSFLLITVGVIWILQGINVLPGSFMTGQIQWAYRGGIAVILGFAILLFDLKWRKR
jgi:hypothetical protein